LYVEYLDLPSPRQKEASQDIVDKTYVLATLPNLHSIGVPYSNAEWRNYKRDSVLQMTAGLAAGLRHVSIWETEMDLWETEPWHGSYSVPNYVCPVPVGTKGKLQSLKIKAVAVTGSQLARWDVHTDFSVLRTLKLSRVELSALQVLTALAEGDKFRCLRDLNLAAVRAESEDRDEIESKMTRLMLSLCPLVSLALAAIGEASYNAAISRHGASLQVLRMTETILSSQQVELLVQSCPRVELLEIEILRSAGDCVELATYRTLGSLRYLEYLELRLHCISYRPTGDPDGRNAWETRSTLSAGEMRKVLINTALDKQLALSISQTITAAHPSVEHDLPPKLREIRLRVHPVSSESYPLSQSFQHLLELIGRGWSYRLYPRDTNQSTAHIEELPETIRTRMRWNVTQWVERLIWSDIDHEKTMVMNAWKALWPATGPNWMDKWRGTPLAIETGIDDSFCDPDKSR
jgi:hypothetical protein